MTNQENDGIKAIVDSYDSQWLILEIRRLEEENKKLELQRRQEEAKKESNQTDLLAKQTREKLVEYAPAADEIVDSPDFQEKFCSLIQSLVQERQSDSIDFILDALRELFGINLAVKFTSLACLKIIKITIRNFCNSNDV
jgi:hypothetical protein